MLHAVGEHCLARLLWQSRSLKDFVPDSFGDTSIRFNQRQRPIITQNSGTEQMTAKQTVLDSCLAMDRHNPNRWNQLI